MLRVQGIGGVFLYATDADALARWYQEHLGLSLTRAGTTHYTELPSADVSPGARVAATVFAIFQAEDPLPNTKTARVNWRVPDLDAALAFLASKGITAEGREEDYGRFAWVRDPEGNRLELWEPPARS